MQFVAAWCGALAVWRRTRVQEVALDR